MQEKEANYDWQGFAYDTGTSTIDGERYCPDAQHLYGAPATYVQNSASTDCVKIKMDDPTETGEVTTHTAEMAFAKVLANGDASLYRDGVDARYMDEPKNETTHFTGSATKTGDGKAITHRPGIIDFVKDQGEYILESCPCGRLRWRWRRYCRCLGASQWWRSGSECLYH